jgi:hypothetical protein
MLRRQRRWLEYQRAYYRARLQFSNDNRPAAAGIVLMSIFRASRTILFYPDLPHRDSMIFKICAALGYGISNDAGARSFGIVKWKDSTVFDGAELKKILSSNGRIINGNSLDISKRAVGRIFAEVFGYPLEINPLEFHGRMVEKSDTNATHDGRVLKGPLRPEDLRSGCVYQREIDNQYGDQVIDYRVPILGDEIPLFYLKHRPVESRFGVPNSAATIEDPAAFFSATELKNLKLMSRNMGIDYGELDVLRDSDGRIYVVDANNTPFGPPVVLTEDEMKSAVSHIASAFSRLIEQPAPPGEMLQTREFFQIPAKAD